MSTNSCDCEKEVILIPGVGGVPGPAGPPGPQGPPGAGAAFPIPATNISVTNAGFLNVQAVLDFLLYIPVSISAFSTVVANYEIGSVVSALTFNWTLNKNPITQAITGPNSTPPSLTPSQRSSVVGLSPGIAGSFVGDNFIYTITVNDGVIMPSRNTTVTFLNNIYFGDSVIPGGINSAFVNTLNKVLQSSKARTFVSNATGSQYAWVAVRQALGTVTFTVNGFPGGFNSPTVVSVTNNSGFSENYNVYRSTNPAIGPVTIVTS